ncbi:Bug family tripartite tricarboxylate transporter substrate binding protein [Vandammella animalimorsus]|uniref:Bug family tripartite tricarboxylate transporter substrate binding protein n=1 Tax=Vandammella animalimorsus TaxID=2029117 RepID=UPI000BAA6C0D|nr:tripartite tricarboxylate transporter substrate binding protein [Vandammella animalimorsus]PAT30912.1 MFS transporter [Vandammella animalimorsus]
MKSLASSQRRKLLLAATALTFAGGATWAAPPAWPQKTIRIVVPFPPGGTVDGVARLLQPRLQAALGQTVLIDNRAGAGGTVGVREVARSAPDGYTVGMVFDAFTTYPLVYPNLGFDSRKDLVPVTQMASNPLVLVVNPSVPANNLQELVALAKAKPGTLNYASVGAGSSNHLTAEWFKSVAGIDVAHIPYKGGGPAQQDLLGGQVQMMFLSAVLAQPHVRAGKLRALAQTGATRVDAYRDVPTVAESGYPDFHVESWVGMLAPAGTPSAIIDRLHTEVTAALNNADVKARLAEQGLQPIANTPAQFAQALSDEYAKWQRLISERNLSLE